MYLWRKLTPNQREEVLALRQKNIQPWHNPRHRIGDTGRYLLTSACYEHKPVIGFSPARMETFSAMLVEILQTTCDEINAWCVLPNHYHVVLYTRNLADTLAAVGRIHGRTSFEWNGEDDLRGRKVWCNYAETAIKSERHFWATLNYVHNNAVRHGYVASWQDWPFSSARSFLENTGRDEALRLWKTYPVMDFGKDWDAPDL